MFPLLCLLQIFTNSYTSSKIALEEKLSWDIRKKDLGLNEMSICNHETIKHANSNRECLSTQGCEQAEAFPLPLTGWACSVCFV